MSRRRGRSSRAAKAVGRGDGGCGTPGTLTMALYLGESAVHVFTGRDFFVLMLSLSKQSTLLRARLGVPAVISTDLD